MKDKDIVNIYAWLTGLTLFVLFITILFSYSISNLNTKSKDATYVKCVNETIITDQYFYQGKLKEGHKYHSSEVFYLDYGNYTFCYSFLNGTKGCWDFEVKRVCKIVDAEGNEIK